MATAGLVLGIIGLVCSLFPLLSPTWAGSYILCIFGIIVASVSFVLSLIATIKKSTPNKGPAIAGLVLSVIVFVLVIVGLGLVGAAVSTYR